MLKLKDDALRDDVAAGRRGCTSKQSVQSVREATTASGVDMQPPPRLADTVEPIIHPQRELIAM